MGETNLPGIEAWARACAADGEFRLAIRGWTGGIELGIGDDRLVIAVMDGNVSAGKPEENGRVGDWLTCAGEASAWEPMLQATPPRFHNDLMASVSRNGRLSFSGDGVVMAQYYPALMRAIELLRPVRDRPETIDANGRAGRFDAPTGRYLHLDLYGDDYRIYYEEAGDGIPMLLQHTAGCHGGQWRHLMENPAITDRFRLIAYDLPFHGKSVPPPTRRWWAEPYNLRGEFLRAIPLELSSALSLERPVFMGCSVGGLLALDLAHRHPDRFRAIVSVEGALKIEGNLDSLAMLWHPKVSNAYKARLMEGLMSPTSPEAYRKETSFVYASGWPPLFLGDLFYYIKDYDLRDAAGEIDTGKVGVHILSGEYDYSGTSELGAQAHEAIPGSTWTEMKGLGHFPMSENPDEFAKYLMPILDAIAQ